MPSLRRTGMIGAIVTAPIAIAYRFARVYRSRAGFPRPHPPATTPDRLGLPYESVTVPTVDGLELPGWFIRAPGGRPGPGVVLVHGWESARDRTLPNAQVLHAAGFHCLTVDIRGHGANPPETRPVSAGEFGIDAAAAFDALLARPEVTAGAILGHSMGSIGALLAAANDSRVRAVVATSTPADPYRLTRQTFHLAHLPIPDVVAYPLAWLTTRVYLEPRGHAPDDVSATTAIARYRGPILLVHGTDDRVVPIGHLARLLGAANRARATDASLPPVETLIIEGGMHSWLYEFPAYRATIARFLVDAIGGPLPAGEAAARAAAVPAMRLPDGEPRFTAVDAEPGGVRSLVGAVVPGTGPAAVRAGAGRSAGD